MANLALDHNPAGSDPDSVHHLPLYVGDSQSRDSLCIRSANISMRTDGQAFTYGLSHKRCPESLHSSLTQRPGTASTRSSTSLAGRAVSSTSSHSPSTATSPVSTNFPSDDCSTDILKGSRSDSMALTRNDEPPIVMPSDCACEFQSIIDSPSPIKEEEELTPVHGDGWPLPGPAPGLRWEPSDTETILDFTLQLMYGIDLAETSRAASTLRRLVRKFVGDVGECIWLAPSDGETAQIMSTASSSSTSTPSQPGAQAGGKRKQTDRSQDKQEAEPGDGQGSGLLSAKRSRPNPRDDEDLRLSCPFRKRNPRRFNVRDHHSCAMTYFPKFAELRQHIVKQHKRQDPSAFACDRCNREFQSRKHLRHHQRLPKELMCDLSDHDPESGVDGTTSNKLLSRKRTSGASPEAQWKEIWNILFPDDEDHHIQDYHFTPVIEHFELASHYLSSLQALHGSLGDETSSNPAALETLSLRFRQCLMEAVERCIAVAQNMPYVNRSNKKNEPPLRRTTRETLSRADSKLEQLEEHPSCEESARTAPRDTRPRRGSHPIREIQPAATACREDDLMGPLSSVPASSAAIGIDATMDVHTPAAGMNAWSHDMLFPSHVDFPMAENFPNPGDTTRQTDLEPWGGAFFPASFGDTGDRFAGFGD